MNKYLKLLPAILLFAFILKVIFDADRAHKNWLIQIGHEVPLGDKIGHFLLYGLMALLLNQALSFKKIRLMKRYFLLGSMIVLTFAIAEEFTQLAFESRTFDVWDMLCDVLGIAGFSFLYQKIYRNGISRT